MGLCRQICDEFYDIASGESLQLVLFVFAWPSCGSLECFRHCEAPKSKGSGKTSDGRFNKKKQQHQGVCVWKIWNISHSVAMFSLSFNLVTWNRFTIFFVYLVCPFGVDQGELSLFK